MGESMIPKKIDISEIQLTPKGFIKLVLGLFVLFLAMEFAKWLVGKAKGIKPPIEGGEEVKAYSGRRVI